MWATHEQTTPMSSLALLEQRLTEQTWCRRVAALTDDYKLLEQGGDDGLLGRGTFASVRRYQRSNGTSVAVKEIKKRSLVDNMTKVRQLLVEVAVTKTLQHGAIAQTHEVLLTDDSVYLVMSLCRGVTLQDHLVRVGGSMCQRDTAVVVGQLLSAIACIHVNCLVHRDVKPSNIIVDPDTLHTKLIDFGLGKHVGRRKSTFPSGQEVLYSHTDQPLGRQVSGRSISSEDDTVLATPEAGSLLYLAVEALTGKLESDSMDSDWWVCSRRDIYKLDIYASGATAFRMMAGKLPYEPRGAVSLSHQRRIMSMHPARLPSSVDIDHEGRVLLESMLSKQPARRPAACDALYSPWLTKYRREYDSGSPTQATETASTAGGGGARCRGSGVEPSWEAMMAEVEEDDRVKESRYNHPDCEHMRTSASTHPSNSIV